MRAPASDPIDHFQELFDEARRSEPLEGTTAALGTADEDGSPSVRMVLVKEVDREGFVFYTNYRSRKAEQLSANPRAALCFHWDSLERQVRIEGPVGQVEADRSDRYFATRPRGSQISAWASPQSSTVGSRELLEERFQACERRFGDSEIPRPPFWGGYRLTPERMEFWQAREKRLHDRFLYLRDPEGWTVERLGP